MKGKFKKADFPYIHSLEREQNSELPLHASE